MGQNNLHLADYYLPGYGILYEWKIFKIKAWTLGSSAGKEIRRDNNCKMIDNISLAFTVASA